MQRVRPLVVICCSLLGGVLLCAAAVMSAFVMLEWVGPPFCCGLEGLFPPVVGFFGGAALGLILGGWIGVALERKQLSAAGLGYGLIVWAISVALTLLVTRGITMDIEEFPPVLLWLSATVGVPAVVLARLWIARRPEQPSI